VPLLARHALPSRTAVGLLAPAVPAIRVGAGVPGVMQEMDGPAQAERRPRQLPLARPCGQADGEEQPLFTEVLDGGVRGARAEEGLEEQPHALLDLRVGIEGHAAVRGVDEADGQMAAQLAAARLVQDAAAQAGPQHVQLGFAHGPLETQQQSVVEVRGIVDAILIEDEGVGEGADLQQPVPVGRVAGLARSGAWLAMRSPRPPGPKKATAVRITSSGVRRVRVASRIMDSASRRSRRASTLNRRNARLRNDGRADPPCIGVATGAAGAAGGGKWHSRPPSSRCHILGSDREMILPAV
jgi:hypothetical protein